VLGITVISSRSLTTPELGVHQAEQVTQGLPWSRQLRHFGGREPHAKRPFESDQEVDVTE